MRKFSPLAFIFLLFFVSRSSFSQSLYFPPASGNWQTLAPSDIGWCSDRIDSLYEYLRVKNTKSFIVLKGGKIVLEKYFGTYTQDSLFYWASASKSLAAFLTGIAKSKGLVSLSAPVSQYLGAGWSSAPVQKENLIRVDDLLKMTSGLEDNPLLPCSNEDTAKACLTFKVDAGTRWAYHTGAYKKVQSLVSVAAGLSYNTLTTIWLKNKTGMGGVWFDQTYYSKARDMARFGLLNLAKGIWQNDTLLPDTAFLSAMTRSSQTYNPAYGYLWWLNGKNFYLNPGTQFQFPGALLPNAPGDLYAALGKNDQKIYIVPSQELVVVRQGNSAENVTFALSTFDQKLWAYLNKLNCVSTGEIEIMQSEALNIWPNPTDSYLYINQKGCSTVDVLSATGQRITLQVADGRVDVSGLAEGIYQLVASNQLPQKQSIRFVKTKP